MLPALPRFSQVFLLKNVWNISLHAPTPSLRFPILHSRHFRMKTKQKIKNLDSPGMIFFLS